jgi:hypothetical protein
VFDGEWFDPAAEHKYAYWLKGIPFVHVPIRRDRPLASAPSSKRGPTDNEKGIPE